MSRSSNFDSFCDERLVAVQLGTLWGIASGTILVKIVSKDIPLSSFLLFTHIGRITWHLSQKLFFLLKEKRSLIFAFVQILFIHNIKRKKRVSAYIYKKKNVKNMSQEEFTARI